jgi:hypothetical protein
MTARIHSAALHASTTTTAARWRSTTLLATSAAHYAGSMGPVKHAAVCSVLPASMLPAAALQHQLTCQLSSSSRAQRARQRHACNQPPLIKAQVTLKDQLVSQTGICLGQPACCLA